MFQADTSVDVWDSQWESVPAASDDDAAEAVDFSLVNTGAASAAACSSSSPSLNRNRTGLTFPSVTSAEAGSASTETTNEFYTIRARIDTLPELWSSHTQVKP